MGRGTREKLGRVGRRLPAVLALLLLSACTTLYNHHGYVPTDELLSNVVVGKDTRETVYDLIGPPSSSGVLRDSGYYYVSQRFSTSAWRAPEEIERQVVAISFDEGGVVTNVERFGLQDGNVVALSRRVTASNIEGLNFLQQLFGNIGSLDIGSNL
ncbi:outer membrane protein assembly factor BamE [Tropicimonas sp. IMCC6043]|uniref:outer membrane protein assembly factor BamE n=1 Tax=Tropicimonas sp. IMCC6043 TaxID=2510645 RepID=UPI00101D454B|nr:outer membrane protein assembly factor BamE [Tropicimonas sp. IMCC6043]RYH12128.1 outer membrane protein assembly factor BamE [Tropicimonas sp. IMCC6043]